MTRILFATISVGLVWLYVALVMFLGQSIGERYIGLGLIAASLPFVGGIFFYVFRNVISRGLISSQQILNITLGLFFSLGSLLIVDIVYSLHLNSRSVGKPNLEDSRLYDPAFAWRELYPRLYYPTDQNFRLHKANFSVSGGQYGNFYSPELMRSPTLAESVFTLNKFSCTIDQHGFRNTTSVEEADIFALGDSFTFGWAIEADKAWVGLLEHAIHRPIYNLGIHDASPKQELELLKYMLRTHGKSMKIRKLLWMIYEGNDLEDGYGNKRLSKPQGLSYTEAITQGTILQSLSKIPYLIQEQAMITKIRNGDITFRLPSFKESGYNPYVIDGIKSWYPFYQSASLGPRLFYPKYIEWAGQPLSYVLQHPNKPHLDQVFEEMSQLEKEFSFEIVLIIVPTAIRLHGQFYENFPAISKEPHFIDYVSKLSEEKGFQTLDLLSRFKPYGDKELLYLRDDDHWNKRGHVLAAEIIAREVFQQP